ncbi:diguanylate cyclase domain-containing protein [Lactobacillus delbrueckii subsp. bulgaricus]
MTWAMTRASKTKEQSESPDMDLLTGMPNVSYFSKFGDDFLRKLLKQAGQVDVIYFDISSLHSYNDHFGFLQGNQLIKKCGKIIQASFQEGLTLRYVDNSILTITAPSQLKKLLPEIQKKVADFSLTRSRPSEPASTRSRKWNQPPAPSTRPT